MARKNYVRDPGPVLLVHPDGRPVMDPVIDADGKPVIDPDTGAVRLTRNTFTLRRLVEEYMLNDSRFGVSRAVARRARDIEAVLAKGGPVFEFDGSDWDFLKAACEEPKHSLGDGRTGNPLLPFVWRQLQPLVDAICDAPEEPPKAEP